MAIEIRDLGSDLALRNRWYVPASFAHPAKLHLGFFAGTIEIAQGDATKPWGLTADHIVLFGEILYG